MSGAGRPAVPARDAAASDAVPLMVWVQAISVSLASFMEVLDTSIANVALPHIAGSMAVSLDESTWVLTTYLVANVIVLPISGWISNTIGRKRFFLAALTLFTVSSVLCGMAPTFESLIFFRVLQGIGGGGLAPVSLAILIDSFPLRKRGMAMSIYGLTVVVAPVLGPLAGGWITDHYTWRWIFFINLPVGVMAVLVNAFVLKETVDLSAGGGVWRKLQRIDLVGLIFLAVGLGTMEVVYDRGNEMDWFGSPLIVRLTIVAIVFLIATVFWELWHPRPIVNLRLYKDRNFWVCSLLMFMVFVTLYGSTVLLPLLMQTLMGYTATDAGLVLSPGGLATMLMMPLAGWLLAQGFDARWMIGAALAIIGFALIWMTGLTLDVSTMYLIQLRVVQTFALGFFFVPIQSAAYLYLPREQINNATGMVSMVRNEGASVGVAVLNTVLARQSQTHQVYLGAHINSMSHATHEALAGAAQLAQSAGSDPALAHHQALAIVQQGLHRQSMMLAYLDAFMVFAVAMLAMIPLVFFMRRSVIHDRKKAKAAA